jgi:hypothetical protein
MIIKVFLLHADNNTRMVNCNGEHQCLSHFAPLSMTMYTEDRYYKMPISISRFFAVVTRSLVPDRVLDST